jgi:hypothetical protein
MLNLKTKPLARNGVNGAGNVLKIRDSYKVNRELPRPFAVNHSNHIRISNGCHVLLAEWPRFLGVEAIRMPSAGGPPQA